CALPKCAATWPPRPLNYSESWTWNSFCCFRAAFEQGERPAQTSATNQRLASGTDRTLPDLAGAGENGVFQLLDRAGLNRGINPRAVLVHLPLHRHLQRIGAQVA